MNDLPAFPVSLQKDTRCGGPLSVNPHHAVYSESRKQRNLLQAWARTSGYQPPKQTCCANQIKNLVSALQTRLKEPASTG
jgi:hypothetical protein